MKNFHFESLENKHVEDEIKNEISKAIPFLEKNLDRLIQYLRTEENLNTYIEINLPFLDSNISFQINLYSGKILILVRSFDDKTFYGYLILEGYDCIEKEGLKKIGNWDKQKDRFKI